MRVMAIPAELAAAPFTVRLIAQVMLVAEMERRGLGLLRLDVTGAGQAGIKTDCIFERFVNVRGVRIIHRCCVTAVTLAT